MLGFQLPRHQVQFGFPAGMHRAEEREKKEREKEGEEREKEKSKSKREGRRGCRTRGSNDSTAKTPRGAPPLMRSDPDLDSGSKRGTPRNPQSLESRSAPPCPFSLGPAPHRRSRNLPEGRPRVYCLPPGVRARSPHACTRTPMHARGDPAPGPDAPQRGEDGGAPGPRRGWTFTHRGGCSLARSPAAASDPHPGRRH